MLADLRPLSPALVVAATGALTLLCIVLFLTLGAKGSWSFVLAFRGIKLATLLLVAYAVAISTVLFQTATNNRILTPAVMGFDALYVLLQTGLTFCLGNLQVSQIDPRLLFAGQALMMVILSGLLFRGLFSGAVRSLHLLLLVGILLGGLFRSLSSFLQRVIDPNEFVVLQDRLFANFNSVDADLLLLSAVAIGGVSLVALSNLSRFDVLALGRETAINLGLDHRRMVTLTMALIAVLVSVSTALVGPITFFGLLVANLAYLITPDHRHRHILPVAVFLAIIMLVGGQMLLERLFAFSTALSIVIEFFGGLAFILILMRGRAR